MAHETAEQRAARRRATWRGGVVRSHAELEALDLEQWLAMTPRERLREMWPLAEESLALKGEHGSTPRLQRSVGGSRPRRG